MGCCIYGAIIISRIILAYERAQRIYAIVVRPLRAIGLALPAGASRHRRVLAAAAFAELALVLLAGSHWEHIVSLIRPASPLDPFQAICTSSEAVPADTPEFHP